MIVLRHVDSVFIAHEECFGMWALFSLFIFYVCGFCCFVFVCLNQSIYLESPLFAYLQKIVRPYVTDKIDELDIQLGKKPVVLAVIFL